MAKTLKKWQGWLLFGGAMVIVFVLGLLCSSMLERRAEVASIFNNRRTQMTDSIVAQNEKFAEDFPREYQTWAMTEDYGKNIKEMARLVALRRSHGHCVRTWSALLIHARKES